MSFEIPKNAPWLEGPGGSRVRNREIQSARWLQSPFLAMQRSLYTLDLG